MNSFLGPRVLPFPSPPPPKGTSMKDSRTTWTVFQGLGCLRVLHIFLQPTYNDFNCYDEEHHIRITTASLRAHPRAPFCLCRYLRIEQFLIFLQPTYNDFYCCNDDNNGFPACPCSRSFLFVPLPSCTAILTSVGRATNDNKTITKNKATL